MSLLVVRESGGTGLSLDGLVDGRLATLDLFLEDCPHVIPLLFDFFLLLGVLHLHDEPLVLFEVNAVKGHERGDPNGETGSELSVLEVVLENRITRVLHQVQVLEVWARCGDLVESLGLVSQLVVGNRNDLERW